MALTDGLVSYWQLNETDGVRRDSVGANHLVPTNPVGSADGKSGLAASFLAGNQGSLRAASNPGLQTGLYDWSLHLWFRFDAINHFGMIATKDREYEIRRFGSQDAVNVFIYHEQLRFTNIPIVNNAWVFLGLWYDLAAGTANLQINNGATESLAFSYPYYLHLGEAGRTGDFALGCRAIEGGPQGSYHLTGAVDEVAWHRRVLTPDERNQLWLGGVGTTYPFGSQPGISRGRLVNAGG